MVAGLVLRVAAIVFAASAAFTTTVLAVQMFFALYDGSMPPKLSWIPWATIVLGAVTAIALVRMLLKT